MVPVIAIGFDDLRSRGDAQNQQATEPTKELADLKSRLKARGLLLMLRGWGRSRRSVSFPFFLYFLKLIDVMVFFRSFWSSRRGWHTSLRSYKRARETWRLLWGLRRLVVVGCMERRWLRGRRFGVIFGVQRIPCERVRWVDDGFRIWAWHSSSVCGITVIYSEGQNCSNVL